MGLDVIAFSNAKLVEEEGAAICSVYNANGFDRIDGKPEGRYSGDNEFRFRAGSYGGYNDFREWLSKTFIGVESKMVWKESDKYSDKPFFELVNFGDNDGAFGPVTSAKLALDFVAHTPPISEIYYSQTYDQFRKGFEIAGRDGFLVFC